MQIGTGGVRVNVYQVACAAGHVGRCDTGCEGPVKVNAHIQDVTSNREAPELLRDRPATRAQGSQQGSASCQYYVWQPTKGHIPMPHKRDNAICLPTACLPAACGTNCWLTISSIRSTLA
jgi:hypothetical protein